MVPRYLGRRFVPQSRDYALPQADLFWPFRPEAENNGRRIDLWCKLERRSSRTRLPENWHGQLLDRHFGCFDGTEQGVAACVMDEDGAKLSGLALVAVPDDDAIAVRSACHLTQRAGLAAPDRQLAGAFNQNFDSLAEESQVIFLTDGVLKSQQLLVAALFDFVGHIVLKQCRGFGTGPH